MRGLVADVFHAALLDTIEAILDSVTDNKTLLRWKGYLEETQKDDTAKIALCEEWWANCSRPKYQGVLRGRNTQGLVAMCQQAKEGEADTLIAYLHEVDIAAVVNHFSDDEESIEAIWDVVQELCTYGRFISEIPQILVDHIDSLFQEVAGMSGRIDVSAVRRKAEELFHATPEADQKAVLGLIKDLLCNMSPEVFATIQERFTMDPADLEDMVANPSDLDIIPKEPLSYDMIVATVTAMLDACTLKPAPQLLNEFGADL